MFEFDSLKKTSYKLDCEEKIQKLIRTYSFLKKPESQRVYP